MSNAGKLIDKSSVVRLTIGFYWSFPVRTRPWIDRAGLVNTKWHIAINWDFQLRNLQKKNTKKIQKKNQLKTEQHHKFDQQQQQQNKQQTVNNRK